MSGRGTGLRALGGAAALVLLVAIAFLIVAPRLIGARRESQLPPLAWAARAGDLRAIDRLLAAGADPDLRDRGPNGWTPLMHAVHKGQAAAVERLLAGGARADATSDNGTTALMLAAGQGETAIVRRLLAAGAHPELATTSGATALADALLGGHAAAARALLAADPGLRLGDRLPDRLSRLVARLRGEQDLLALADGRRRPGGLP